jgi:outer membrane protein OmpA-like peptidoglycan-associated protein
MNALAVVSVAFVVAAAACRADVPPQRPAAPDVAAPVARDADLEGENSEEDKDTDGDGIPDGKDACPNEAEDRDGFDDTDGCPDPDNDHDRILDVDDKCPNEPETYNGLDDDDGCPESSNFAHPVPHTPVPTDLPCFDEGSAKIRPDAAAIIDTFAAFINDPARTIMDVTIEGHAAAYEKHPPALAAARAEAVRRYLVRHGVRAALIHVKPFGTGPYACDRLASGCDDRRVCLLIGVGL